MPPRDICPLGIEHHCSAFYRYILSSLCLIVLSRHRDEPAGARSISCCYNRNKAAELHFFYCHCGSVQRVRRARRAPPFSSAMPHCLVLHNDGHSNRGLACILRSLRPPQTAQGQCGKEAVKPSRISSLNIRSSSSSPLPAFFFLSSSHRSRSFWRILARFLCDGRQQKSRRRCVE